MKLRVFNLLLVIVSVCVLFTSCSDGATTAPEGTKVAQRAENETISPDSIPEFSGKPYVAINDNMPSFTDEEKKTTKSFESYSELDSLGRCGVAFACCGKDLMPIKKRENISAVKPTGWHSVKYSNVEGESLYNRCHLLAHELTGEDANEKNLITGTRYMNATGMLPFENMVADYIKETGNHVMYRVTPIFDGDNLVADGVQMEAWSVEDDGDGICFNIFCYDVQPGIVIDYKTGESRLDADYSETTKAKKTTVTSTTVSQAQTQSTYETASTYVLNVNSKKFHLPNCSSVKNMKEENKKQYSGSRDSLIKEGYKPCGSCKP